VNLDATLVIGRNQTAVQEYLTSLGLTLDPKVGTPASSAEQVGLAYSVSPKDNVRRGEVITVTFYGDVPPPPSAPKPSAPSGPADGSPEEMVTITWPAYSGCPAGHPLTGIAVSVINGELQGSSPMPPGATSADVVLSPTVGETTQVTYTAICTDFESPASDPVTITVS
jgi:serine/threonine-protein kinase